MGGTQSSNAAQMASSSHPNSCNNEAHPRAIPKNTTLLHGCSTMEEHDQKIAADIARISEMDLTGSDGLRALGFEFRFVPCGSSECHDSNDKSGCCNSNNSSSTDEHRDNNNATLLTPKASSCASFVSLSDEYESSGNVSDERYKCCTDCATRLFYIGHSSASIQNNNGDFESSSTSSSKESSAATMITPTNRKQYIADGRHYDLIAQLAQQSAQSLMCTQFNLQWITLCNDPTLGPNVRAMVDEDHPLLLEEGGNRVVLRELLLLGDDENGNREEKKDEDDCLRNNAAASTTATDTTTAENNNSRNNINVQNSDNNNINNTAGLTNKTRTTLLIATGRGKVRAGIFSRQHLLTAGIEVGTAWHFVREARIRRGWGVAIVDPNARGEGVGFDTFRRSYSTLFLAGGEDNDGKDVSSSSENGLKENMNYGNGISREQSVNSLSTSTNNAQSNSIYVLAHSAGGAQLVRHLREDASSLPFIKAIAFTDSSHNVQWCKNQPTLKEFLQKKNCVYVRSNDVRSSQSCVHVSSRGKDIHCGSNSTLACGEEASTDQFWEHRFGKIRTLWAGHPEHSLSNYAGREIIWDHFDEHSKEEAN